MKAFEENISEHTGLRSQILEEIIYFAQTYNLSKVILFGSRARGDYSPKSDIDLAVAGDEIVNFHLDIDEKTDTLLQFDLVDLNSDLNDDLLADIRKDGIVLYEKV